MITNTFGLRGRISRILIRNLLIVNLCAADAAEPTHATARTDQPAQQRRNLIQ